MTLSTHLGAAAVASLSEEDFAELAASTEVTTAFEAFPHLGFCQAWPAVKPTLEAIRDNTGKAFLFTRKWWVHHACRITVGICESACGGAANAEPAPEPVPQP
jgi:hypothetical protein